MPKAKNLKYCRKKANLTQQEFADAIGASKATVIAWEARKTAIPAPSAKRIAKYFSIDYAIFCDVDIELMEHGRIALSEQETQSLLKYRQLPVKIQNMVRQLIAVLYDSFKTS